MPNTVVKMPQLGESVAEGTIGRWLKQPGDRVERDEPLVEIQTDKVNAEVPSPVAGILQQILLPEGATASVKTDMAIIGDEPADVAAPPPAAAPSAQGPEGITTQRTPAQAAATSPPPLTFTYDKASSGGVVGHRDEPAEPAEDGASHVASRAASDRAPTADGPSRGGTADATNGPSRGGPGSATEGPSRGGTGSATEGPSRGEPGSATEGPSRGGTGSATDSPSRGGTAGVTDSPSRGGTGDPTDSTSGKRFYTPVVLRMAEEHGIDLSMIQGSGAHGRVTRKDVERAISSGGAAAAVTPAPPSVTAVTPPVTPAPPSVTAVTPPVTPAPPSVTAVTPPVTPAPPSVTAVTPPGVADEDRALTPMRRAIAEHMARARAEIPDAWSLTEIDVTGLVRYRESLQAEWRAREGYELTYLPFFVKAVLAGLRAVPELNATWAGDHVVVHRQYHLGIAVSVDNGLIVPVLRDADQLSVAGVARALRGIIQKARSARLTMDDLQGATFTVNNPGSLGSIMSQPIVPVGQAGIVTMEAVIKRPVVTADDAIAIRSMMNSCLSFDHRILDGAGALQFLRTVKRELETVQYPLY